MFVKHHIAVKYIFFYSVKINLLQNSVHGIPILPRSFFSSILALAARGAKGAITHVQPKVIFLG